MISALVDLDESKVTVTLSLPAARRLRSYFVSTRGNAHDDDGVSSDAYLTAHALDLALEDEGLEGLE